MKNLKYLLLGLVLLAPILVQAQIDTLYVYGPGGPFGPINECAKVFSTQHQLFVKVVAGPESNWINEANKNADLVFGGAEYMLTQFSIKHPALINTTTRQELYKRGAGILVRTGNPKKIHSLKDLTTKGVSILDVNGAGQFGLWEDLAGKENLIEGIQKNIHQSFENTALGIAAWKKDPSFDAWISYSSWHYRLTDITTLIKLPSAINVYRGTPIAISKISAHPKEAALFIQFMQSEKGHDIFKKWGWE
jgi:accessory colonization factor AcfC